MELICDSNDLTELDPSHTKLNFLSCFDNKFSVDKFVEKDLPHTGNFDVSWNIST